MYWSTNYCTFRFHKNSVLCKFSQGLSWRLLWTDSFRDECYHDSVLLTVSHYSSFYRRLQNINSNIYRGMIIHHRPCGLCISDIFKLFGVIQKINYGRIQYPEYGCITIGIFYCSAYRLPPHKRLKSMDLHSLWADKYNFEFVFVTLTLLDNQEVVKGYKQGQAAVVKMQGHQQLP